MFGAQSRFSHESQVADAANTRAGMTTGVRSLMASVSGLVLVVFTATASADMPDADALLEGAKQARYSLKSGKLELNFAHIMHAISPYRHKSTVKVLFDGDKRTIHQSLYELVGPILDPARQADRDAKLRALGNDWEKAAAAGLGKREERRVSTGLDGQRFCAYKTDQGAVYKDLAADTTLLVFHPRMLGVCMMYNEDTTWNDCFRSSRYRTKRVVGREVVNGRQVWHIEFDLTPAKKHVWVDDKAPFQIVRIKSQEGTSWLELNSTYRARDVLPNGINLKHYVKEKLRSEVDVEITSSQLNCPIDGTVGTMASLDVPIGTTVTDEILHKNIGAWNGVDTSRNQIVAREDYRDRQMVVVAGSRLWPWFAGGAALAVIGVLFFARHRHSRAAT